MIPADSGSGSSEQQSFFDDIARSDTDGWDRGFPVSVVAFTLLWGGALGLLEYLWASTRLPISVVFAPAYSILLLLMGAALLFARSRPNTSRALASISSVFSAVYGILSALIGPAFEGPTPFDAPRELYGSCAVLLSLLSLAIMCSTLGLRARHLARWLVGTTIVLALIVRIRPNLLRLEFDTADTANFVLLIVMLTGAAVISLSQKGKLSSHFAGTVVARTVLLGSLVAVLAWYALTNSVRSIRKEQATQITSFAAQAVSRSINENVDALKRMTLRWDSVGSMPKPNVVRQELRNYLSSIDTVDLVAVISPDFKIQWYESEGAFGRLWLEQSLADPRYLAMVQQAHQDLIVQIGSIQDTTAIAAPLTAASLKGWTIVAFHDSAVFVAQALGADHGPIKIRISQDDRLIYYGIRPGAKASYIDESAMPLVKDHIWELSSWYEHPPVPSLETLVPDLILLICLIFTYLLSRSQRLTSALIVRSGQLQHAAMHDALTGLPNLVHLKRKLRAICNAAVRTSGTVWVILFDLDGIRLINGSLGQSAGDQVLREVARRLEVAARGEALVASLKGNEFVVAVSDSDESKVLDLTTRMLDAIAMPIFIQGSELGLTASAGITVSNGNSDGPLELVREAYLAMAHAKLEGHNNWLRYSADLNFAIIERLELRNKLQAAMETDVLQLYYQPLVDGQSGRIVSAEALLRWPDADGGYISPAQFIPLAEETGMIVHLTRWVLERACRDITALRARNLLDFPLQINISPLHFQRDDFVQDIRAKLAEHSVPSECLAIEITEGMMMGKTSGLIGKLQELRALGIKVAIDDFGTGYSSLSYLKNLPIDKIKIDQSFVKDVVSNHRDASLVKAIIALAHNLNVGVVAEGVETESQFWFLKRNFCDAFQGYLFAHPMPLEDFARRLLERGSREPLPEAQSRADAARTLLLLDDEQNILRALNRLLRRDGYKILTARTPQEAFTLLAENEVHVIMSDQRMPETTGTEFFSSVKRMYPATVRLILSGYTDLKSVTEAVNHGAIYKFLIKPWDDEELRAEIAQAFRVASSGASGDGQSVSLYGTKRPVIGSRIKSKPVPTPK